MCFNCDLWSYTHIGFSTNYGVLKLIYTDANKPEYQQKSYKMPMFSPKTDKFEQRSTVKMILDANPILFRIQKLVMHYIFFPKSE